MEEEASSLNLRTRPKKTSSLNLSSCFPNRSSDYHPFPSSPSLSAPPSPPHFLSPSSWFRSMQGVASPGKKGSGRRRRHSADFSYDPLSYSLNFDDGGAEEFSVRSPAALPRRRLRDFELPPIKTGAVRSPLNREGEKDKVVSETARSGDATTPEMSVILL